MDTIMKRLITIPILLALLIAPALATTSISVATAITQAGADSGTVIKDTAFTVTATLTVSGGTASNGESVITVPSGFTVDGATTQTSSSYSSGDTVSWTVRGTQIAQNQQITIRVTASGTSPGVATTTSFDVVSSSSLSAVASDSSISVSTTSTGTSIGVILTNNGGTSTQNVVASITIPTVLSGTATQQTSTSIAAGATKAFYWTVDGSSAGTGSITITVTASNDDTQTVTIPVTVTGGTTTTTGITTTSSSTPEVRDMQITINPSTTTMTKNMTKMFTVNVKNNGTGIREDVNVTVTTPNGITGILTGDQNINLTVNQTKAYTLTLNTGSTISYDNYTATITAQSKYKTRSVNLPITITEVMPPDAEPGIVTTTGTGEEEITEKVVGVPEDEAEITGVEATDMTGTIITAITLIIVVTVIGASYYLGYLQTFLSKTSEALEALKERIKK